MPGMIAAVGLAVAGSWSLAVRSAAAQGAECLNPRGMVEQIVCQDAELSALSQELRQALRVVIRSIPRTQRPQMLRDQRDWTLSRNRCIRSQDVGECLRIVYEDRIGVLGARLAGSVGGLERPPRQRNLVDAGPVGRDLTSPPDRLAPLPRPAPLPQPAPLANAGVAPIPPVDRRPLPQLAARPADTLAPAAPAIAPPARPARIPPPAQVARVAPPDDGSGSGSLKPVTGKIADTLASGVWRAEITSGIRPGTIYVFQRNGVLLTADCVQAYRLGSWNVASDNKIVLTAPNGETRQGQIVKIRDRFVRIQIKKKSGAILRTLILRPAVNPFDCSPDQG